MNKMEKRQEKSTLSRHEFQYTLYKEGRQSRAKIV